MAAAQTTDLAPATAKPPVKLSTGCNAVREQARQYPGWNPDIIQAISHAESHCRADATGDGHLAFNQHGRKYGYSVSALQVRILPGREACDSHNLKINVKCAYKIWLNQGYGAWTKFNNGEYKKYL